MGVLPLVYFSCTDVLLMKFPVTIKKKEKKLRENLKCRNGLHVSPESNGNKFGTTLTTMALIYAGGQNFFSFFLCFIFYFYE